MPELDRALSKMEEAIWLLDQAARLNYTVVARVRGPLDETLLRRGLDALQARHPSLRVGIVAEGGGCRFQPGAGPIPLRVADDWRAATERELGNPFDWEAGPFARLVWCPLGPDDGRLLLTMQHCVGDGMSGMFAMRDLLKALAGESLAPLPPHPAVTALLPERVRSKAFILPVLGMLARRGARTLRHGRHRIIEDAAGPVNARRMRLWYAHLEPDATTALLERARAGGTTVHGLLSATLMQAVAADHGHPVPLLFGTPVDLRRRLPLPVPEALGLYVGEADGVYRVDPEGDPFALARRVRANLLRQVDRWTILLLHRYGGPVLRQMRKGRATPEQIADDFRARFGASTGLTNLGRVDVPVMYGPRRLDALHFVVATSALGDQVTTATSHDGHLRWNYCAADPTLDPDRAAALWADAVARIRRLAGGDPR